MLAALSWACTLPKAKVSSVAMVVRFIVMLSKISVRMV
jgi:hypothetical protein